MAKVIMAQGTMSGAGKSLQQNKCAGGRGFFALGYGELTESMVD